MKLVLAIIRDDFAADVTFALNSQGFSITRISTTGGFWRRGNVTLLLGVDEAKIDEALEIINTHAGPTPAVPATGEAAAHPPRRATIFVMNVDTFAHY